MAPFVEDTAIGRLLLPKMSEMARSSISSPASRKLSVAFGCASVSISWVSNCW